MARQGQSYIVTGGASGLGLATVELLSGEGANVMILDRNVEQGNALVTKLGSDKAAFVECDVTSEESVKKAVAGTVEKFGRLDGVVNCAGVGSATTTLSKRGPHPLALFDMVTKINLYGTFNVARFGAEAMAKNEPDASGLRGVIINVASVAAFEGQKGQVAYAASKGAVVAMSLPMARDLSRYGIRVMAIAPGIMDTPMMKMVQPKVKDNLLTSVVAPKRFGHMSEFAHLVKTIIDNKYLNAQTIRMDAGIRMANL
jgi:3-hydroxyacyl-CoA dehydrogenase/3-hydroxy-2-methylbutyryl-CoA dehydrogenase